MNRFLILLPLLTLPCAAVLADDMPMKEGLGRLKALKVEHAASMEVSRDPTDTRTVVKLLLQPAKGSNIRVEAWLPDSEKCISTKR